MALTFSLSPDRPRLAVLLAALALFLSAAVPAAEAASCRVIVVRSADLQPHREVVRGIKDSSSCLVREMSIRDHEGPDRVLAQSPDLVIAVGTASLRKLKGVTSVPVIYAMAVPSEALGLQAPNISGVSMDLAPAIHLAAVRDLFPGRKRVGVIYDPGQTGVFVEDAVKAARAAGLELVLQQIHDPSRMPAALSALENKADVLWMLPDPTVVSGGNLDLLLRFSFQRSVPIFTFSRKYAEKGAVASVAIDPYDIGVQAGELANRVKDGGGPAVEYARDAHVTVNAQVAEKMGLHPAAKAMRRANRID